MLFCGMTVGEWDEEESGGLEDFHSLLQSTHKFPNCYGITVGVQEAL